MSLAAAARGLAERGFRVHPLRPGQKAPLLDGWPEKATSDVGQVEEWWSRWPDANVGLATGRGLMVVDLDGEDGTAAWERLGKDHAEDVPPTMFVATPRGWHLYFAASGVSNSANRLGPHVDVRGDGGFVVGPGSVVNDVEYVEHEGHIAKAPAWLVDMARGNVAAAGNVSATYGQSFEPSETYGEGQRNDGLFRLASSWRARGMTDAELLSALLVANRERCTPPLDESEVRLIVSSVSRFERGEVPAEIRHGRSEPRDVDNPATRKPGPSVLDVIRNALMTSAQLAELPKPDPLAEGWLSKPSFAVIYGPTGSRKSFVAMDLGLSVAAGIDWYGIPTTQGTVIYEAGEGAGTLLDREAAWRTARHVHEPLPIHWLPIGLRLMDEEWSDAMETVAAEIRPALIVIDTLHRSMPGGDENTAKDMGLVIDACTRMSQASGGCVLLVHHTGWNETRQRGSSSLKGAIDTEIEVKRTGDQVVIRNPKQRHMAENERPIILKADGAVLQLDSRGPIDEQRLTDKQQAALDVLTTTQDGLRYREWLEASELPSSTFDRALRVLETRGLVRRWGDIYRLADVPF